jgi:hypothetical protein
MASSRVGPLSLGLGSTICELCDLGLAHFSSLSFSCPIYKMEMIIMETWGLLFLAGLNEVIQVKCVGHCLAWGPLVFMGISQTNAFSH